MAYFRPVYIRPSKLITEAYWVVERTALGVVGENLPEMYKTRKEARDQAKRLNDLEPKAEKPHA